MQVDEKLLTYLEKLSYLKVSDDKRQEIVAQLSEVVAFVDNLSELDTKNVDETFAMNDQATFMREDLPNCDRTINEMILKNAPLSDENFFIVPKIIE